MICVFVDSDACPVKDEVYRVTGWYGLRVFVVSNRMMAVPQSPLIERVVERDIVIMSDIPSAARCVAKGACVLEPKGRLLDSDAIGMALAMRNLMTDLREVGVMTSHGAAV